ncbi:MAG: tetratricopeptide repeat protein [Tannerellaceae bacterium]|jgi:signal transduction histidine kinase|nr:tetratricopeptide repeat protein [Tannerellaceae bacterium]
MKQILTLCLFALLALNANGQSEYADSLVNILETGNLTHKEQLRLYYNIYDTYVSYDIEKASGYAKKGLTLAEKEDDKAMSSRFNAAFGRIYNTKSDYDKALVYWEKAVNLAKEAKDADLEASAYLGIGILYARQDKYPFALEYFIKALSIYEDTGQKQRCMLTMRNMASMYRTMENEEKALYYLDKAKNIAEETDDANGKMMVYFDLGAIYHKLAENDQNKVNLALKYELEAYEISCKLNDKAHQVAITQALSAIYSNYLKDHDMALKYAEESLKTAQEFGDPKMIIAALNAISSSYLEKKRYKQSEAASLEAWKIDSTDINMGSDLLRNIILCNIAIGNENKAEQFFGKYRNLVRRHIDQNSREMMADMEMKYETEKKEMRIASLEKERQLYVWLGITGLIFALSLGIALWLKIRNSQKERQLVASNAVQEGEMSERERIAGELHDRLLSTLSAVKSEIDNTDIGHKLNGCIEEVRRISRNLMPLPLRNGIKTALEDFTAQFPNVRFHFFGQEKRVEKRLEFVIYCCANELVTNSIRHSGAENINVQLVQGENHMALTVQDDGCGFDEKTVAKGVGLKSIRDRVTSCNGKMDIFSVPDKGTETVIEINI